MYLFNLLLFNVVLCVVLFIIIRYCYFILNSIKINYIANRPSLFNEIKNATLQLTTNAQYCYFL